MNAVCREFESGAGGRNLALLHKIAERESR